MTSTRGALVTIQQMMDKAQGALHRNAWFEAERLAARSLELARGTLDFALMARITLATHQIWMADWVETGMTGDPDELVRGIQAHTLRAFCPPDVAARLLAKLDGAAP